MPALENLTMLYLHVDDLENAKKCLDECKEKYFDDKAGIEFLEEEFAAVEWQVNEGIRIPKGPGGYPGMQRGNNDTQDIPNSLEILQNYPNPGNPSTTIRYSIPESGHVTVKIVNIRGQEIRRLVDGNRKAG